MKGALRREQVEGDLHWGRSANGGRPPDSEQPGKKQLNPKISVEKPQHNQARAFITFSAQRTHNGVTDAGAESEDCVLLNAQDFRTPDQSGQSVTD